MKNVLKIGFVILLTLSFQSCAETEGIPDELSLCFKYLDENLDSKEIEKFKSISENDIVEYHFSIGMHLRNNLLRHHKQSKKITDYFNSIGIYHYDDMSSIILTSYHRHLNDQGLRLNAQLKKYIEYWEPIADCQKSQKKKAVEISNSYNVGDTLNIQMPVSESNSVIDRPCPEENMQWEYDEVKDLEIDGVITDKYFINDSTNLFFTVKVLTKSHLETKIMMEEVNIGDEFKVSLRTAWKIFSTN